MTTVSSFNAFVGRSDLGELIGERGVFELTETLFKNRGHLVEKVPAANQMREDFARSNPEYPRFAGATKFYEWHKAFNWNVLALFISSLFSFIFLGLTVYSLIKQHMFKKPSQAA